MKKKISFRFKYTTAVVVLLIFLIAIAISGIVLTSIKLATPGLNDINVVLNVFYLVLEALFFILGISTLIFARYDITDKKLKVIFGIIVFVKTNVSEITEIKYYKGSNDLVAFFKNGTHLVIIIDKKEFDNFYNALKEINPSILYESESTEE